jgi:hypothetical protein
MTTTITSPVGEVVFASLNKPIQNKYKDGREEYTLRLMFDGTTTEGKAFRQAVAAVNPNKIVTQLNGEGLPAGKFIVGANSKYQPTILDNNGTVVEDVPSFPRGTKATAIMTVTPRSSEKGGTVMLNSVAILSYDTSEVEPPTTSNDRSESLEALRRAIQAAQQ